MNAVLSNAIPDNSGYFTIGIPVSGLPTTLGTGAGQARLESVEFIISHATNDQLDITLSAPGGAARTLSMDRFGTGDNYGNPASCPGSAFVMRDGATALTNSNTNNPTGPYAPTDPLSGYTGNPNGTWSFNVRDDAAGTTGNIRYVKLNFCVLPEITSATSNSPICAGTALTLNVSANNATSYAWTGTGTYTPNNTSASVSVANAATGSYGITVTNACGSVNTSVPVVVNPAPTAVAATSSAASVCSNNNSINLTGAATAPTTVIFSEGFNSGTSGWVLTNTSTGGTPANAAWTLRTSPYFYNASSGTDPTFTSNDNSQFVLSNSDSQGSGNTATILRSPAFSTVGYNAATLSFHHVFRQQTNGNDRGYVEVSTDNSNWTTINTYTATTGTAATFASASFALPGGFLGQSTVYVRFRYTAPWGWYWGIDNVSVSGTGNLTYAWTSTPSGFTSAVQNPTGVSVTQNTTYNLTVTAVNGCTATDTEAVTHVTAPSATIAYTRPAYCVTAGTASVTRTGTSGGTYSSTPGLTINPTTGTVTPSTSTPGTYTITYTIAAATPCAQFQTTTQMTIDQIPTVAAAGGDQTTCAVASVTLAGNTPTVGIGTWSVISGPSTSAAQFSNVNTPGASFLSSGGPGTYTLRWSIDNGACTASTDDVVITVNACAYYSRGTGNVGDAIWSLTPSGTAGAATWNASTNMVVQSGNTITTTADLQVGSITVDNGGTLVLGGFNLTANGAMVDINGTLTANDNSTLTLAGSGVKSLDLASATSFWNLTCNTPDGTTLTGNASIRNTLLLPDGEFDCTGNPVTLASNATRTGRLGPVGATASYTGQLVVNRHIPAGATNWRMFGSSVAGRTVNDLKDDFYTAGFPGSHSPNFASPVGSGILWPSIRWYDETNTGAGVNDGLTGATGTSQALTAGQGFAAWCGTGLTTTTAFNVDVTGAPNIASTPITLPMSYTNTGVPATDGWNMVSNPLPSPIAFDQISRGADVADYVTYFNPANGNLATWDISEGLGTNGGSNIIQSSQGFWLKATGSAVTTTVEEQDKVEGNTGGFFGGAEVQTANLVRLRVESNINQYSDETVVVFSSGQPAITSQDVPKFIFAHPDAPQIASMGDGGEMIAINAFGPYTTDISIPVTVDVAVNGDYTIVATGLSNIGLSCVRLEDLATNTITPLVEGTEYTFTALAADDVNEARFLLHATAPLQLTATDATCNGTDDGSASLQVTSGPVDIIWTDADGVDILEQNGVMPGTSDLVALAAGEYSIRVVGDAACNTRSTLFTIEEPAALEAETITLPSSCPDTEDGRIDLTVLGGEAPYTFQWSNEATTEDLDVAAGTYTVLITDANGCTFAPQEYVVGAGEGPDAGISVENTVVQVGDEILFAPNTYEGVSNTWDFGDGATSTDLEATHTYDVPGTYTVTLTVDNGDCISTATLEVAVETTTGITTEVGRNLNAWVSGDLIVVDHDFGGQDPVLIRVFNAGGQLAMEKKVAQAPARITLPANELATGVWLVRVSSGAVYRTFALPIVH